MRGTKFKRTLSFALCLSMVFGIFTIAPMTVSASSYEEEFIDKILDSMGWAVRYGENGAIEPGMTFMDLNFDGKLEFIVQETGGSMRNFPARVFYYEDGMHLADVSERSSVDSYIPMSTWLYVDTLNYYKSNASNNYMILGYNQQLVGRYAGGWTGNYKLVFENGKVNVNYYSANIQDVTFNPYSSSYTYYNGADCYGDYSHKKISEYEYNNINKNMVNGYTKLNVTKYFIKYSDWKKLSYSERKKELFKAYDQFSYNSLNLGVGETSLITDSIPLFSVQNATWSSNNTSVATVDSNGKVTAKKTGTATITAKTSNGKTASCNVTVKPAPTSVKINPSSTTLGVGETLTISENTNSGSWASADTLQWTSTNSRVATVTKGANNKATIKAVGTGTATITIKTYNGKTASCNVTVKPAPTSVKINPSSTTLGVGETLAISENTNSGSWASADTLQWTSTNSRVATVTKGANNKATIKAVGTGTATITIKTYNGKTATCKVTVKSAPASVKINPSSTTLGVGETLTISENTNSGSWASADTLQWTSTNSRVATVTKGANNKATIKAVGTGTATITIKTYNGKTATCKVTVK